MGGPDGHGLQEVGIAFPAEAAAGEDAGRDAQGGEAVVQGFGEGGGGVGLGGDGADLGGELED